MTSIVLILLLVVGYFYVRKRIMHSVTDSVTRSNMRRLGRMMFGLIGVMFLFLLLFAVCNRAG